jgi:hypothetical protein
MQLKGTAVVELYFKSSTDLKACASTISQRNLIFLIQKIAGACRRNKCPTSYEFGRSSPRSPSLRSPPLPPSTAATNQCGCDAPTRTPPAAPLHHRGQRCLCRPTRRMHRAAHPPDEPSSHLSLTGGERRGDLGYKSHTQFRLRGI